MIDIHAHILPNLDDGPASLEDAVNLVEMASESGVTDIVATSHGNYYEYDLEKYWKKFFLLAKTIKKYNIPVDIYPGMEIWGDDKALSLLESGNLLTLNEGKTVLLEFDLHEKIDIMYKRISEFQQNGWRIILAHPERYADIYANPETLDRLLENDCALQINYGSLQGNFGENAYRISRAMLRAGMVQFIASDGHSSNWRTTSFKGLIPFLRKHISAEYAKLLLEINPVRLLKNQEPLTMEWRKIQL